MDVRTERLAESWSDVWFDFIVGMGWVALVVWFIHSPARLFHLMISELQGFYVNICGTNAFQFLAATTAEDERCFPLFLFFFFLVYLNCGRMVVWFAGWLAG